MKRLREANINTAEYWTKQWPSNPQWSIGKSVFTDVKRLELMSKRISNVDNVLDVGGGRGEIAKWIEDKTKCNITVVDFSESAVRECEDKRGVAAFCLDFNEMGLRLPNSYFDVVISGETLEHVEDPAEFIQSLVEMCRPGGWIVVSTPLNDYYPTEREHVWSFDEPDLAALFKPHGAVEISLSDASIVASCRFGGASLDG